MSAFAVLVVTSLICKFGDKEGTPKGLHDFKPDACVDIMSGSRLQAPKKNLPLLLWTDAMWGHATDEQKLDWAELDCVGVLGLYTPVKFRAGEVLPKYVLKPALTSDAEKALLSITKTVIEHLNNRSVPFVPVFGTQMAAYRNDVLVLPWDDDIDFAMLDDGDTEMKVTRGLTPLKNSRHWCRGWRAGCRHWKLGNYVLTRKASGMPWKVNRFNTRYPSLDMNTYTVTNGKATIARKQLGWGHIHKWNKDPKWIGPGPYKHMIFNFSMNLPTPVRIPWPASPRRIVLDDYGADALETCKPSHIHKPFCKNNDGCENPMANHLSKFVFPCSMLPCPLRGKSYKVNCRME